MEAPVCLRAARSVLPKDLSGGTAGTIRRARGVSVSGFPAGKSAFLRLCETAGGPGDAWRSPASSADGRIQHDLRNTFAPEKSCYRATRRTGQGTGNPRYEDGSAWSVQDDSPGQANAPGSDVDRQ